MEVNKDLKLPIGYRFKPTDEELIKYYLRKKVAGEEVPSNAVIDRNVYDVEPWQLLDGVEKREGYYFSRRTRRNRGKRPNRNAGCGYWKATGGDVKIMDSVKRVVIGYRISLVFGKRGDAGFGKNAKNSIWIMHEYRLSQTKFEEWIVCRIRKRGNDEINDTNESNNEDTAIHNQTMLLSTDHHHHHHHHHHHQYHYQQQQQLNLFIPPLIDHVPVQSMVEKEQSPMFMGRSDIFVALTIDETMLPSTDHHHYYDQQQQQHLITPSPSMIEQVPVQSIDETIDGYQLVVTPLSWLPPVQEERTTIALTEASKVEGKEDDFISWFTSELLAAYEPHEEESLLIPNTCPTVEQHWDFLPAPPQ